MRDLGEDRYLVQIDYTPLCEGHITAYESGEDAPLVNYLVAGMKARNAILGNALRVTVSEYCYAPPGSTGVITPGGDIIPTNVEHPIFMSFLCWERDTGRLDMHNMEGIERYKIVSLILQTLGLIEEPTDDEDEEDLDRPAADAPDSEWVVRVARRLTTPPPPGSGLRTALFLCRRAQLTTCLCRRNEIESCKVVARGVTIPTSPPTPCASVLLVR